MLTKPLSFAVAVISLIVCSEVSANDWQENDDSSPGITYCVGYVRINGVKYLPETRALQLAERQALALEQIAARLKIVELTTAEREE